MALVFSDGKGYCDLSGSAYKYEARGYFPSGGPNTRTGSIDPGPYPGTFALHLKTSDPWSQEIKQVSQTAQADWIVGLWVYPVAISANRPIVLFQENQPLNPGAGVGTVFVVQIAADGSVLVSAGNNNNIFVFPTSYAATAGTVYTSQAKLPMNKWSHICLQVHMQLASAGRFQLYINNCLDISQAGLNLNPANLIGTTWKNPSGPDEIFTSQLVINDVSGTQNNSVVSKLAQIETIFPMGQGTAGWSNVGTAPGYACVNENPGPDGDTTYITLGSLGTPDETFSIPALTTTQQNLAVVLNMCTKGTTQTLNGLVKKSGMSALTVGSLVNVAYNLTGDYLTMEAVGELDPYTGLPWQDSDIGAYQWGVRGITGTNERITQYFIEKLWQTGPAVCLGSYAWSPNL